MTSSALILLGILTTLFAAVAYCRLWCRFDARQRTPTGFGALLAVALLAVAWLSYGAIEMRLSLVAVTAGTAIYWFDDAFEMSARARLALAAVTGAAVGLLYFGSPLNDEVALLAVLIVLAAFVNVALVNSINMQDGADLNLAVMVILTGVLMIAFADYGAWTAAGWTALSFAVAFALVNARPRRLYFGDSGCFALAGLFTVMGAAFVIERQSPPPEAAIPLALPLIDMAFVTAHRIRIRQRFTVRHYFHLYQRLQNSQPGFAYLLPQIAAAAMALGVSLGLRQIGAERFIAVTLGMVVAGLLVFWIGRQFFVRGEPGPPPDRGSK